MEGSPLHSTTQPLYHFLPPPRPAVQEQGDRFRQRPVGLERVELGPERAAGVVQRLAVAAEVVQVHLTGNGRLAEAWPLPLEPAELRPLAERELHLVRVEHLDQDRLVAVVAQAGQALAE